MVTNDDNTLFQCSECGAPATLEKFVLVVPSKAPQHEASTAFLRLRCEHTPDECAVSYLPIPTQLGVALAALARKNAIEFIRRDTPDLDLVDPDTDRARQLEVTELMVYLDNDLGTENGGVPFWEIKMRNHGIGGPLRLRR